MSGRLEREDEGSARKRRRQQRRLSLTSLLSTTALIFSAAVLGAAAAPAAAPPALLVVGEGPDIRLSLDANSGTSSSLAARATSEREERREDDEEEVRRSLIARGAAGLPARALAPRWARDWFASMMPVLDLSTAGSKRRRLKGWRARKGVLWGGEK